MSFTLGISCIHEGLRNRYFNIVFVLATWVHYTHAGRCDLEVWRTSHAYRSHFRSESSRMQAQAISRSTSQMAPGSLPFILLCSDAFDFQYQSLAVLCSCLRKVTESQKSFTKNIDEKLTQIRWRELNPSLFLLELSVFCETHWFAVTFIFYPDIIGFVFAFTWGRILIQSSHPVLQVGLRLGWSHH